VKLLSLSLSIFEVNTFIELEVIVSYSQWFPAKVLQSLFTERILINVKYFQNILILQKKRNILRVLIRVFHESIYVIFEIRERIRKRMCEIQCITSMLHEITKRQRIIHIRSPSIPLNISFRISYIKPVSHPFRLIDLILFHTVHSRTQSITE